MIWNRLGRPARFLMVATAVACWIPCVPEAAAGMPLPQVPPAPPSPTATAVGSSIRLTWTAPTWSNQSFPITGYEIEIFTSASPDWRDLETNTGKTDTEYLHANPPQNTIVWYRVAAITAGGTGDHSGQSNQVETTGSTRPGTPGAPRNLTAVAVGTAINLDWDEPFPTPGKTISGYQVNVSTNRGVNFAFLTNTTATEYRHEGLSVGATRHYRVRALYSDGDLGPAAYANATTVATAMPGAPQNLRATAAGPTVINLAWSPPAWRGTSAINDYQVRVSADLGASWGLPQTTNQTSFHHTGLAAGTTRHYEVRARNASGPGPWTSVVSATTSTGTPPGPPRALTATAVSSSAIDLSWSPPGSGGSSAIVGYRIERSSTRTGGWGEIEDDTGNTRTTYRDTGLAPNTTYYYRVSAINSFATGGPSNVDDATTEPDVPNAPGRLTAQARGISVIELDWRAPSSSGTSRVTGYQIQSSNRRTGGWRDLVDDTGDTRTTYPDTALAPSTTRYYRVAAISDAGTSAWSNIAHATTDDLTVPGAPTSLTVVPNGLTGSTELRLTWRPPANTGGSPITGYSIQWSPSARGPWRFLVPGPTGTATTYVDEGLAPNTTRYYRVRALNAQGQGNPSTAVRGTTDAARPDRPRNLRERGAGPDSIILNWDAPASNGGTPITGYTIRRSGSKDGPWMPIVPNTGSTATTYTNTGLQPATFYWYQVAAINRVGTGDWSFEAGMTTHPEAPDAPTGLTARPVGTSRIDLSWSAPRNTGGAPILAYRIDASDDGGGTWQTIRRHPASAGTRFSDLNLQPATTRRYRVAAINTAGTGPFSNTARATTEATVPGTPRSLDAEADGTSRIELSWREPTSDGGSRITGYRIEVSEDGGTRWDDLVANTRNTRTTYAHTGLEP
ncbi:MAG: fibronectin type III domain-containing protein, partial [Gammaproteobacteria bacterium]|nr:fibronectin type III domain-containing protein [Gammaproteobacteria bacterium]